MPNVAAGECERGVDVVHQMGRITLLCHHHISGIRKWGLKCAQLQPVKHCPLPAARGRTKDPSF